MIKISSNLLFVIWFCLIIILDRIGEMFDISIYTIDLILLAMSGMFLYAIHKVNMDKKGSKV